MDGNNPSNGTNGDPHSNGLAVSISSFEVQYRHKTYPTPDKYLIGHEPQMRASNQMYQYLSADLPFINNNDTSISRINLLKNKDAKPIGHRAAWIVTIGPSTDANDGKGGNAKERTGRVTKVVYLRDGYQVTITGNNASVDKYEIPAGTTETDSWGNN